MESSSSTDYLQLPIQEAQAQQSLPQQQQQQQRQHQRQQQQQQQHQQQDSLLVASRPPAPVPLFWRVLLVLAIVGLCIVPFIATYELNHTRAVTDPTVAYDGSRCQRCDKSGDCAFAFNGFRCKSPADPSGYRCCLADNNLFGSFKCDEGGDTCWKPKLSNSGRNIYNFFIGVVLAIVGFCTLCFWCRCAGESPRHGASV